MSTGGPRLHKSYLAGGMFVMTAVETTFDAAGELALRQSQKCIWLDEDINL